MTDAATKMAEERETLICTVRSKDASQAERINAAKTILQRGWGHLSDCPTSAR